MNGDDSRQANDHRPDDRDLPERCLELLGWPGRMISPSKSSYSAAHPDHLTVFNANICIGSAGKAWYGDLDLTIDEPALRELARRCRQIVYVLRERDGRFGNEASPLLARAVYSITPSGHDAFRPDEAVRIGDGSLRRRLPPCFGKPNRPGLWRPWQVEITRPVGVIETDRRLQLFLGRRPGTYRLPCLLLAVHQYDDDDRQAVRLESTWCPSGPHVWAPTVEWNWRRRLGRLELEAGFTVAAGMMWAVSVDLQLLDERRPGWGSARPARSQPPGPDGFWERA